MGSRPLVLAILAILGASGPSAARSVLPDPRDCLGEPSYGSPAHSRPRGMGAVPSNVYALAPLDGRLYALAPAGMHGTYLYTIDPPGPAGDSFRVRLNASVAGRPLAAIEALYARGDTLVLESGDSLYRRTGDEWQVVRHPSPERPYPGGFPLAGRWIEGRSSGTGWLVTDFRGPEGIHEVNGDRELLHALPQPTLEEFARLRPGEHLEYVDEVVNWIGAFLVLGRCVWFGTAFYEGEGRDGVGAIGVFDLESREYRLEYDLPRQILDASVSAIHVDEESIWLGLEGHYEGEGASFGLVRYDPDRRTVRRYEVPGVVNVILPHEGLVYLATTSGIHALDGDRVRAIVPGVHPGPPRWEYQVQGPPDSTAMEYLAVSAVDQAVAWAAGRGGVVARTVDGGRTWVTDTIAGDLSIIDVHGFDSRVACALAAREPGGPSTILRTTDSGRSWSPRFIGPPLNAMAFWDADNGLAYGNPVDSRLVILRTEDGCATWIPVDARGIPRSLYGETGFALGGTSIAVAGRDHAWIGTGGGYTSYVLRSVDRGRTWAAIRTAFPAGPQKGIYGVAFRDTLHGVAVGGEPGRPYWTQTLSLLRTEDGGRSWALVQQAWAAQGLYSAAVSVPGAQSPSFIAVGPFGSMYSVDDGRTWVSYYAPFNSVSIVAPDVGWAVGSHGRIAYLAGAFPDQ